MVFDTHTAKVGKFHIGDKVTISSTGEPSTFTLVGIVTFSGSESTGGPTWALFDLKTAENFVLGQPGMISSVSVGGDGTRSQSNALDYKPEQLANLHDRETRAAISISTARQRSPSSSSATAVGALSESS